MKKLFTLEKGFQKRSYKTALYAIGIAVIIFALYHLADFVISINAEAITLLLVIFLTGVFSVMHRHIKNAPISTAVDEWEAQTEFMSKLQEGKKYWKPLQKKDFKCHFCGCMDEIKSIELCKHCLGRIEDEQKEW